MNLAESINNILESDAIVENFNNGALTAHQAVVALQYLKTIHFYDFCPISGQLYKSFSPCFGDKNG